MSPLLLIVSFFFYSFIGWILDTSYRSWYAGRYTTGSFLPLPLCPIYGFGALIVLYLHSLIDFLPIIVQGMVFGIVLASFEYVSGRLVFAIFKRRLWQYEKTWFSVGQWTDLPHAIIWGLLALALVIWIHPLVLSMFP